MGHLRGFFGWAFVVRGRNSTNHATLFRSRILSNCHFPYRAYGRSPSLRFPVSRNFVAERLTPSSVRRPLAGDVGREHLQARRRRAGRRQIDLPVFRLGRRQLCRRIAGRLARPGLIVPRSAWGLLRRFLRRLLGGDGCGARSSSHRHRSGAPSVGRSAPSRRRRCALIALARRAGSSGLGGDSRREVTIPVAVRARIFRSLVHPAQNFGRRASAS